MDYFATGIHRFHGYRDLGDQAGSVEIDWPEVGYFHRRITAIAAVSMQIATPPPYTGTYNLLLESSDTIIGHVCAWNISPLGLVLPTVLNLADGLLLGLHWDGTNWHRIY